MMYTRQQRNRRPTALAFTLVEIMVSVAIFSIIMLAATGAYLNLIALDRQTRATNDVVDNLSFAIDTMARSIRTGSVYQCGGPGGTNCTNAPSTVFTFNDANGNRVTYLLRSDGSIGSCSGLQVCDSSTAIQFTDPRITIDKLNFYVRGDGTGDGIQPQVVFVVHGTIPTDPNHKSADFTIQTTATQRGIDL